MNLTKLKTLTLGFVLLLVGSVASFSHVSSKAQSVSQSSAQDKFLKEIAGYRNWTRVNETPRRSNNFQIDGQDS
ncbi:MAG: hypothetical protein H7Y30_15515 [Pyrinomonadaceae bacterium]|nr:hypothetical protein [Pyrinomonadaceae bacterium]